MSNEEVEKVMEDFMNKLFVNPNLLEDEKLNFKIEQIFENKVFQRMVENANVLEDAGIASNSQIKTNKDKSEDYIDMNKNILDSKLIEESDLPEPYKEGENSLRSDRISDILTNRSHRFRRREIKGREEKEESYKRKAQSPF